LVGLNIVAIPIHANRKRCNVGNYPIQKRIFRDEVVFSGDKQLVQRLLLNLTDNALKHTERGHIEFALQVTNDKIELTISDTGKEYQKQIFLMSLTAFIEPTRRAPGPPGAKVLD